MPDPIEPINPSFDELPTGGESLAAAETRNFRGDLVQTFGGKKSTIIAVGVMGLVGAAVIASHFMKSAPPHPDKMQAPPQIASTQGGKPLTQAYQADIQSNNADNAQSALQTGGSSIATPVMPAAPPAEPDTSSDVQAQSAPTVDFSDTQSSIQTASPNKGNTSSSPNANGSGQSAGFTSNANNGAFNKDTAQAMMDVMKGLASTNVPGPTTVVASYNGAQGAAQSAQIQPTGFSGGNGSAASNSQSQKGGESAGSDRQSQQDEAGKLVPAAGTILYARMIGELNSDAPGPALATIVAGPLAGARILGQFQTERAGLVVKFDTMTVPAQDGSGTITTPINAVAVSASDLTSGMATSINEHLISNLAVTFVAGFAQGFGQALSQSGSTTTTTGSGLAIISNPALTLPEQMASAAGTAAGAAGGLFQQLYGNRPPTIKLAAGTPFALVFLGTQGGVTNAQTPVQSVDQGQSGPNSNTQKFTPTLPAHSNFGSQIFGQIGGN